MGYTTQQLLAILEREMGAACRGERVLLDPGDRLDHPILAQAMDLSQAGKVFAYQDFRAQIHAYQRDQRVSGLIWREVQYNGDRLGFPELHNQLIAIPGDKEHLMAARSSILAFWHRHTGELPYWFMGHHPRSLTRDGFEELWNQGEWAELDVTLQGLSLGICWGNPEEAPYQWAKPNSGCHRVLAAQELPPSVTL